MTKAYTACQAAPVDRDVRSVDESGAGQTTSVHCVDSARISGGTEGDHRLFGANDLAQARIIRAYDRVAEDYDDFYSGGCFQAENDLVRAWLAPRVRERTVLDIGCGTGFLLDLCPEIAPDSYLGVDPSPKMLEVARRKHSGYTFQLGNMCDLAETEDGAFSSVVSLWSFQYALRPKSAVAEIRRVLQPHGYLSVLTNAPKHVRRKSYLHHGADLSQLKWSGSDLKELCGEFEDVQMWGLNAFADALRRLPARWIAAYLRLENRMLFPVASNSFLYVALAATKPAVTSPATISPVV